MTARGNVAPLLAAVGLICCAFPAPAHGGAKKTTGGGRSNSNSVNGAVSSTQGFSVAHREGAPEGVLRSEPLQLVSKNTETGRLQVVEESLELLQQWTGEFQVVAVVGPFHSGEAAKPPYHA